MQRRRFWQPVRLTLKVRISSGVCVSHFKIQIPSTISEYAMDISMTRRENSSFMRSRLKLFDWSMRCPHQESALQAYLHIWRIWVFLRQEVKASGVKKLCGRFSAMKSTEDVSLCKRHLLRIIWNTSRSKIWGN